jgi:hypothetical protein
MTKKEIYKKIFDKFEVLERLYAKRDNQNMLDPLDEYSKILKEIEIVKTDIENLKKQWGYYD